MKYAQAFLIMIILWLGCELAFGASAIEESSVHFVGNVAGFESTDVGANLVTNGDFESAGAGGTAIFTGWTNTAATANLEIQDVDTDQVHGGTSGTTHACNIWTDNNTNTNIVQYILTTGKTYRVQFDVTADNGGGITVNVGGCYPYTATSVGRHLLYMTAPINTTFGFFRSGNTDMTIDNVSVVEWVGSTDTGGGCTLATYTGDLTDYMDTDGSPIVADTGCAVNDSGGGTPLIITENVVDFSGIIPGTLVYCDFSAAYTDAVYEITAVTATTITIDYSEAAALGGTVDVNVGGAYPDIQTALSDDSTSPWLDVDDSGTENAGDTYWNRIICTNLDETFAASRTIPSSLYADFRASGKRVSVIGFDDSLTLVDNVLISDMAGEGDWDSSDNAEYRGPYEALRIEEGMQCKATGRGWVLWDGDNNAIDLVDWQGHNISIANLKVFNTSEADGMDGLYTSASRQGMKLKNCYITGVHDLVSGTFYDSFVADCYFGVIVAPYHSWNMSNSFLRNCVFNGNGVSYAAANLADLVIASSLFYKGDNGVYSTGSVSLYGCIFYGQTEQSGYINGSNGYGFLSNCILAPEAISDYALYAGTPGGTYTGQNNNCYAYNASDEPVGALTTNFYNAFGTPDVGEFFLPGTTALDPQFKDPANGDFTIQNRTLIEAGIGIPVYGTGGGGHVIGGGVVR